MSTDEMTLDERAALRLAPTDDEMEAMVAEVAAHNELLDDQGYDANGEADADAD